MTHTRPLFCCPVDRHFSSFRLARLSRLVYLVVLTALCVSLLTACGKQTPLSDPALPLGEAATARATALWGDYTALSNPQARPFRVQMSLRYGPEGDSRRVVALLWGNTTKQLRLDVMAGVGVTVANISEQEQHFLLYDPGQQKAYFHQGSQKPLLVMGVPVPLGLGDLSALLQGQYSHVFGTSYSQAQLSSLKHGDMAYRLDDAKLKGVLTLNAQGRPVLWQENGTKGWVMDIAYTEDSPPLPRRIEINHPNGKRAIILVKERDFPPQAFTDENLRLILPEDTPVQALKSASK